jgi:hypothetical protein
MCVCACLRICMLACMYMCLYMYLCMYFYVQGKNLPFTNLKLPRYGCMHTNCCVVAFNHALCACALIYTCIFFLLVCVETYKSSSYTMFTLVCRCFCVCACARARACACACKHSRKAEELAREHRGGSLCVFNCLHCGNLRNAGRFKRLANLGVLRVGTQVRAAAYLGLNLRTYICARTHMQSQTYPPYIHIHVHEKHKIITPKQK